MNRKNYDINLFKAASKEDKKIQTGVSKSFIFVILGLVLVIAVGAFITMTYMEVSSLRTELQKYEGYRIYSTSVNQIADKINKDIAYLNRIQSDIDAGIAIKDYAKETSKLYPGLTQLQQAMITTNRYIYKGTEHIGCVPDTVIIDSESGIGVEYSFTDGINEYEMLDRATGQPTSVVFDKGYIVLRFQSTDDNATNDYINNIINRAPKVFAIEDGQSDLNNITQASFEHGIISEPNEDNPYYVLYIKARLKSALQIILEDEEFTSMLHPSVASIGIDSLVYSNNMISMQVSTDIPIYKVCTYFESTGLFESIDFSRDEIKIADQDIYHVGTIVFFVKEAK